MPTPTPPAAGFNISSYLKPAQVQMDITLVSSLVMSMISAPTKTAIHDVATGLLELAMADVTVAEIDALIADAKVSVPAADVAFFHLLLNGGVATLNLVLAKFGTHNPEIVAYAEAIANGLLAGGF